MIWPCSNFELEKNSPCITGKKFAGESNRQLTVGTKNREILSANFCTGALAS